ncbi:muconolactone Delta-isomerase [Saccharopolyspora rhizosphaerae]|uniref:Muconolactone Delta-isomerase n=1 Tax=Saccharopolyspora rhizosphaerae TaxID=2492662 RepID=A0A3R8Q8A0_9PSEU|nr:muconolactone Delta-isomerase [Saccharopolyspora rhizosphaerae]RRO20699.1 muconolactone Delta-isomerase [Saccharopolyspora rhizosphaerae]
MLYHIRMDVKLPPDLDPDVRADLLAREKEYSQKQQREGRWPHLWRVAGEYANISVVDVADHDELHEVLSGLPLFAYMDIEVTPLAVHPNKIAG